MFVSIKQLARLISLKISVSSNRIDETLDLLAEFGLDSLAGHRTLCKSVFGTNVFLLESSPEICRTNVVQPKNTAIRLNGLLGSVPEMLRFGGVVLTNQIIAFAVVADEQAHAVVDAQSGYLSIAERSICWRLNLR